MRSPLRLVGNLSLAMKSSWYRPATYYSSQNATPKKKAPKGQRRSRKDSSLSFTTEVERAISKHTWLLKMSKVSFLYLLEESVAKEFARLVAGGRAPDSTAYTVEINSGAGTLTRELLRAGIPSIAMYEEVEYFWPGLTALKEQYPDRLTLNKAHFSHVMNMGYWDWKDNTQKLEAYLGKVANTPWRKESVVEIIGVLTNLKFLRFLVASSIFQNNISKYGRLRLYVAVPPSVSQHLVCDNKHYILYRSWVVMFQTLFHHEYLGELPRSAFYPRYNKTEPYRCKYLRKLHENDHNIMHVVKIEARTDVFNDEFKESDTITFFYFVHHHLKARTSRIIPSLEQWIPGCGRSFIAEGYTIFTEFGELKPAELLRLFIKFKSCPGFTKSSFMSSMSSFFLKMEDHFILDDTTENIDEMFQSRMKEYEKKLTAKNE